MSDANVLRYTQSICPECRCVLTGRYEEREGGVFLVRTCPEHGEFASIAWRGQGFERWLAALPAVGDAALPCAAGCQGLESCSSHLSATCCVLLEVTSRCNLSCVHCFAARETADEPSLEEILGQIKGLARPGQTLLQLSGGEPTLRGDLPQIIAAAKEAGCAYVQLNSNGLRLADEPEYAAALAKAGLSFVFLQFDGVEDGVYQRLRGADLWERKQLAIRNCARARLGVTLVPTLVPGVNTDQVGRILAYAIAQSPGVRGVHFQPVCHMGRAPSRPVDSPRFTLDQLMDELERQTEGQVRREQLLPSTCDHPLCGFHSDFVVLPGEKLYPLSIPRAEQEGCCSPDAFGAYCGATDRAQAAAKNRAFVARRWQRPKTDTGIAEQQDQNAREPEMSDMTEFLDRVRSHGFTLTAMAFQDAGHLDLDRLSRCSLHVYHRGKHIPFCAFYL